VSHQTSGGWIQSRTDGVALVDRKGRLLFCDRGMAQILGISSLPEVAGKSLAEFLSASDWAGLKPKLTEVVVNGRPFGDHECSMIRTDGTTARVEFTGLRVDLDSDGAVLVIIRCPSESIQDSISGLLPSLLAQSCMGLLLTSPEGEVLQLNEMARALLGVLAGKTIEGLPADILAIDPRLASALQGRRGELQVRLRDGSQKFVRFCGETLSESSHRLIWLRDATDEVMERERRHRAEQLAFSGKMASRLSHKINNPLGSILAGLQALEKGSSLPPDDLYVVELLLGEVRSMNEIIDSILDSARTTISSAQSVSPEHLVGTSVERFKAEAVAKQVSLALLSGPADLRVLTDMKSMGRALRNIVLNALEACQRGGSVQVGWREVGDHERKSTFPGFQGGIVGIFCTDSGKGLPEELSVSSMFKPFVTTKRSGVGLGLAVAQEIVENHGGVILVSSIPPFGTTVEAFLPLSQPHPKGNEIRKEECGEAANGLLCENCEVKESESERFCWLIKGLRHRSETGAWNETCIACPTFLSRNLAPFLDSSCR
jgi:signal transduction histidine kinase